MFDYFINQDYAVFGAILAIVLIIILVILRKHFGAIEKRVEELKAIHQDGVYFLCKFIEDLKGGVELRGEVIGGRITPQMRFECLGINYTISEVYLPDMMPEDLPEGVSAKRNLKESDPFIVPGYDDSIIFIDEIQNFDYKSFKQELKKEKSIAIKINASPDQQLSNY